MALAAMGGPLNFGGSYSATAAPTGGQGAFGAVPGQIGLPPSLYSQALGAVPGLNQNAQKASSDVQSLLQGEVSPDTQDYISRLIAAKGVTTGVAGTEFNQADLVKSLGLTSEQLQLSGLGAYNQLLTSVGQLQESPELMANIAERNAMMAAAPDPTAAHDQLLRDLEQGLGLGMDPVTGGYGSYHTLGPAAGTGGFGLGGSTDLNGNPYSSWMEGGGGGNDYALVGGPGTITSQLYGPNGTLMTGPGSTTVSPLTSGGGGWFDSTDYSDAANAPV